VPDKEILLQDYNAASGWDLHCGAPTRQKLEQFGLDFAAAE